MKLCNLLSGVSLGVLTLAVAATPSNAQEQLPTIDVGAAQPVSGGPGVGQGTGPGLTGAGNGTGAGPGGYGGAGPAQDPYNKSYVLQNASTGTKTDTPVMDTPLNVQTVSQQVLRDQQATTFRDTLQNVSGVFVPSGAVGGLGSPDGPPYIRGFPADTIYINGFRLDSSQQQVALFEWTQLANVANIEVLKGPGAVLYGLSEPGGVININTKEPLNAPYYRVEQQFGSFANYRTTMDVTGPLNDDKSVLYRVNMSYQSDGAPFGYPIDLTDRRNIFIAPVIKWNVDEATWVKLESFYSQDTHASSLLSAPIVNGEFIPVPRNTSYVERSPETQRTLFNTLTWSHNFDDDWAIKQQLAYMRVDAHNFANLVDTASTVGTLPVYTRDLQNYDQSQTSYSTNVDITGHFDTFGAKHTLLVGGDIYKLAGNYAYSFNFLSSDIGIIGPAHPGVPTAGFPFNEASTYDQVTAGLYLQDQIKLPYNFFALAGARYQYLHQTGETTPNGGTLGSLPLPGPAQIGQKVTPRFGLLWRPQEWASFYGAYTQSFGPNSGLAYPGVPIAPTSAESWESGLKLEFFDGKLRATADYFDLIKNNIATADPLHNGFSILSGKGHSKGVEFDLQGQILPGWDVIANYTHQDVRVASGTGGLFDVQQQGQPFAGVPENLARLWTTYEFPEGTLKGLKVGGGYTYHGSQPYITISFIPTTTLALQTLPSYGTVDLMGAYSFDLAGQKLKAQVNITNLFNRSYVSDQYVFLDYGYGRRSYGAPFRVLGSLSAELDKGSAPPALLTPAPASPSFSWTGLYVGAHAGYAWGDNSGNAYIGTPDGLVASQRLPDLQGVIGGAHVGYNYQFNRAVIGVEGSVDPTSLSKDTTIGVFDPTGMSPGGTFTGTVKSDLQGSIRARAGLAFDRALLYGTGGVAFANFTSNFALSGSDPFLNPYFTNSGTHATTRTGWTAGGGVEYALNNQLALRAEYRYSDFGHLSDFANPAANGGAFSVDRHPGQQQLQVGFSYKLFADPEPVATPRIVKGPALAEYGSAKLPGPKPAIPTPPFVMNWTGFYAGAQIGYGWGDNHGSIFYATPGGLAGQSALIGDATGVIGGAHLGYNRQFDKWVVGVEGAVDPTLMSRALSSSSPDVAADPNATLGIGSTTTGSIWSTIQGSVRARAGYAFDRVMFYGTGGLAIGAFGSTFQVGGFDTTLAAFYGGDQRSATRVGWTLGGGLEYAINPHWSVRGEYRYTDFGHIGDLPAATSVGVAYAADRHLDQNQVQFGFSYKFGEDAPVSAKY